MKLKVWKPEQRSAIFWQRFHYTMAIVWALALIPTLIWWKDSILWVAGMSLYANIVGHWGAAQASRAEVTAEK